MSDGWRIFFIALAAALIILGMTLALVWLAMYVSLSPARSLALLVGYILAAYGIMRAAIALGTSE